MTASLDRGIPEAEFVALWQAEYPRMVGWLAQKCGADAEDVLGDVWRKAWEKRHQFIPRESPRAWINQIAQNAILDYLRHHAVLQMRSLEVSPAAHYRAAPDDPEQVALDREVCGRVAAVLPLLSTDHRAHVCWALAGLTQAEAAARTGQSVELVKQVRWRAKQAFRAIWDALPASPHPHVAITPAALRALRAQMGCTQKEAAALVGATETTWCEWENGHNAPSWRLHIRLAALLRAAPMPNRVGRACAACGVTSGLLLLVRETRQWACVRCLVVQRKRGTVDA